MVQDIITTLGITGITTIAVILMALTSDITLGMVGVLDLVLAHRIRGGVIIIGDRDGTIGDHIITDHHTITEDGITDLIDRRITEEAE